MSTKFYPLSDFVPGQPAVSQNHYRAIATGDFRPPKKGEWYLSGAIPAAYRAPNDLSTAFHIMRVVKVERIETYRIVE